ncbi:MAG TPA: transporter substrate-binding domain-containing protein [Steroidobacter sp.]|uniref:substrate-binding periplasmic protein n=1 Tax=Steroidobacter sp. TaxID=1978227 RepID=UPI002ED7E832
MSRNVIAQPIPEVSSYAPNGARRRLLGAIALLSAGAVGGFATGCRQSSGSAQQPVATSALSAIRQRRRIRAGFSGFKPYTIANPADAAKPGGFVVDVLGQIAARMDPPLAIEWTPVTFESLRADMDTGRVDIFADAVYQTIPRAADFLFTRPFGYFGIGVGIVRRSDTRFTTVADLDREDVTIALAQGWTSTEYAQRVFTRAKLDIVPVGDDGTVPLQKVLAGRADAALQDVPTVAQFVEANSNALKALNLDNPPARVAAGFLLPSTASDVRDFLDVAIEVLRTDGTLARIATKWRLFNEFPQREFAPSPGQ